MQALEMRTQSQVMYFAVQGAVHHLQELRFYFSPVAKDFFTVVMKLDPYDFIRKFEAWSVSGLDGKPRARNPEATTD